MEAIAIAAGLALLAGLGGLSLYVLRKGYHHEATDETRKAIQQSQADDSPETGHYR